ncbi:hypothetical protein RND71_042082 [Anisodus tanguticus]|uniref:Uncharacterized protein n=1 Tax=Anisodus tanguticus TaxID=243964 RepID=A0AAE1QPZ1_9SOLA|nr:hypothetical protein RND71_042082 [Anisodus tanguticus]
MVVLVSFGLEVGKKSFEYSHGFFSKTSRNFYRKLSSRKGEASIGAKVGSVLGAFASSQPEAVANMMQHIRNHIRGLEERKEVLLQERRELIARVARIALDSQRE